MNEARHNQGNADPFGAFVARAAPVPAAEGPLSGLRLAVKDNIAVKGEPFTAGLPLFADRRGDRDAPCVARLKEAGAQFVGMTQTDSAGFGVVTPDVSNPVWPGRIVGGSSGGSAAAVAADLADIGLGTDTGGSTRIPAACCGIFGFKSSHGRIPLDGVWPLATQFDTIGWMTRDLATLERVASVLFDFSPTPDLAAKGLRLGIDRRRLARCSDVVRRTFEAAIATLTHAGIRIDATAIPQFETVSHAHAVMVLTAAKAVYADWPDAADRLPPTARRSLAAAKAFGDADAAVAQSEIAAITDACKAAFGGFDAILTPTLPVEPPAVGQNKLDVNGVPEPIVSVLVSETCLANIIGAPAISMPVPGTAVSLQLLAPKHDDARLFAVARAVREVIGAEPLAVA